MHWWSVLGVGVGGAFDVATGCKAADYDTTSSVRTRISYNILLFLPFQVRVPVVVVG